VAQDDYVYIRNDGDRKEELYDEHDDPWERLNRASDEVMLPRLKRLRQALDKQRKRPRPQVAQ
jgi:hypothetical protein